MLKVAWLFLFAVGVGFGQQVNPFPRPLVPSSGTTGTVTSAVIAGTANQITASGTCTITTTGTCTLSVPSGFVLPGTINGLTLTTSTGTITLVNAKVLTVNKSLTLDGTDGVTLTFPTTSATIARTDAAQTFTGTQTFSSPIVGSTTGNVPSVLISTSGPVSDPGGLSVFQFNNAAGALTFTAPAGVAGYQRCYRNATGKSGAITIQMPTSNTVDLNGTNSSSAGTLVSTGAAGDSLCIASDATNHWYAYINSGSWSRT